ncbi:methylated-DNA--[protein]-cysteine S-methyltransferase [Adlercreutzia sp. R21]|uniref:methylated-DNA--[protein]-cysteine S-methyltransferase n=1 Tax=Adlercreutzia wanghongyangiae TaxID=3111451 RepID=UPI002DB5B7AC|nr:methylated-DNA--[protein]-cysteine S-methyltransferase [Adlercreutzia sp. R21]MEC4183390.1 methylated-DNA--[protein]-cysteine S-methyltransferase [Adlercreutzia sp. R21]
MPRDDERTFYTYPTAFGPVTIGAADGAVTDVVLGETTLGGTRRPAAVTNRCATEIMEYLAGKRAAFTVARAAAGTSFQREVWEAVTRIPYGQTRTARDIAAALGAPDSYRAVGTALRACPTPLLVPTHRVVTAAGKPADSVATALLNLEQRVSQ